MSLSRLVFMLVVLLVPGGSLFLLAWAAAKTLKGHREGLFERAEAQVAMARSSALSGLRER